MTSSKPAHLAGSLAAIAAKQPDRLAIAGERPLSYAQLIDLADAVCARLQKAGVRSGERVAVILPNSADFVIAAFGVWKRGAILVPLHTLFREDEIVRYLADSNASAVISTVRMRPTVEAICDSLSHVRNAWLCPPDGGEWQQLKSDAAARPDDAAPMLEGDSPALTQFSTGSTGMPKRVTRSHSNLLKEALSVSQTVRLTPADKVLGAAPFFHCYGLVNAVLCPILSGATLYAANDFFPRDVAKLIEKEAITGFPGVPFMFQLLADLRETASLKSLRYVLSAGAPLPPTTAEAFHSRYGVRIRQLYGSTETGVVSVEPEADGRTHEPSVGFPIDGVTVRVMDQNGQPIEDGRIGAVAIRSPSMPARYDRAQTQPESHFKDGFFFPGDLGRLTPEGRLVLCGRARGFINVAGNKVDPSEIESVLRQFPGTSEVVVLGVPDGAAGEKIKAVLVTSAPSSTVAVMAFCSTRLAEFKRPKIVEFRKELPKSPLGKVLRKYLLDELDKEAVKYKFNAASGFSSTGNGAPDGVDLSTLPPFLRVLLVTDGTVTKSLEAFFWEPIDVDLLLHARANSEQALPAVGVEVGDPILRRRVVLRGRITSTAYAFAETILLEDGFSSDVARQLVEGRKGLGELIRARRMETYREIVSVGRSVAGEWAAYLGTDTSANVLHRTYTISHGDRPVVQILEVFSESAFSATA